MREGKRHAIWQLRL